MNVMSESKQHETVNHAKNVVGVGTSNLSNPSEEVKMLKLSVLRLSEKYRFRVADDEETVIRYSGLMQQYLMDKDEGITVAYPFDPIYVIHEDKAYAVIAGRHRCKAGIRAGMEEIPCIVLVDHVEAIQVGLSNNRHGLPLGKGDTAHCIRLAVKEVPDWSNRRISEMIGCCSSYVNRIVREESLRPAGQTMCVE